MGKTLPYSPHLKPGRKKAGFLISSLTGALPGRDR
jgi:hypothetical protein